MVFQKPREQADRLPPPRALILGFTLTHTRFERSHVYSTRHLTHGRYSDGAPQSDGVLRVVVRKKILHYRQLYISRPDPVAFMPVVVDTVVHTYDDFSRLLFLYANREVSVLVKEIPEESGQLLFLRDVCYADIKESVGLILVKVSVMGIGENFGHEPKFG